MHIFVIFVLLWCSQSLIVLLCYGVFRIRERITVVESEDTNQHDIQIVSRLKA